MTEENKVAQVEKENTGGINMTEENKVAQVEKENNGGINMTEENKVAQVEKENTEAELKTVIRLIGISDSEEKKPEVILDVYNVIKDVWVETSIPRDKLSPRSLKSVIVNNNGYCPDEVAIYDNINMEINTRLINGQLNVKYYHSTLGWKKNKEGECIFYGDEAISQGKKENSSYNGIIEVKSTGSVENVTKMINTLICNQDEWCHLEVVLAFGVGATALSYAITNWNISLNNFIIHILGDSTSGKSTSLMLFTALGSNPEHKKGFWNCYQSTVNAIVKRIGNNHGFPVTIDELSSCSRKELDDFVYTIGNGEEKDRLAAGGAKFQVSATFQTVIMSSGEVSLYKKCSQNGGIRARCLELSNIDWTSSKEQSEAIQMCMKENYGLVTPLVAQELIDNDAKWRERWNYWKQFINDRLNHDNVKLAVAGRISDFVVLFTLSAELLNSILNVNLNVHKVFDFCYLHIILANEDEGNIGERAYSVLCEYIASNKEKFADARYYGGARWNNNNICLNSQEDGFFYNARSKKINDVAYDTICALRPNVVNNVLAEAGFTESKVCLRKLADEGYLSPHDKKAGKMLRKITVNGNERQKFVAIYYKDLSDQIDKCVNDDKL